MKSPSPIDLIFLSSFFSFFSILGTIFAYKESRKLRDNPISTVRAAAHGYVQLQGKIKPIEPLNTPLTKEPCCFYQLVVRIKSDDETNNDPVFNVISSTPFILEDETGECRIEPSSNMTLEDEDMFPHFWHGTPSITNVAADNHCIAYKGISSTPQRKIFVNTELNKDQQYFFREFHYKTGSTILVCGTLYTDSNGHKVIGCNPDTPQDESFIVSSLSADQLAQENSQVCREGFLGILIFIPLTLWLILYFKGKYFMKFWG